MTQHIFTGQEAAVTYALSAERIFNNDFDFLIKERAVIPIFVSLLFQSLEISIKHAGIASGLFTEKEARKSAMRNGHGIKEFATLAAKRLRRSPVDFLSAMTNFNIHPNSAEVILQMIRGEDFEKTRACYASRCLGYAQVADGDFSLIDSDISGWIAAVKETATNLPKAIDILSQWKASPSKSKHFTIGIKRVLPEAP